MKTKFYLLMLLLAASIGQVWGASPYNFSGLPTTGWSTKGGSQTINGVSWTYSASSYIGNSSSRIQVGSKNNPQTSNWTISTAISNFGANQKITSVSITAYTTNTTATYDISVGGASVKSGSLTTSSATYTTSSLNATSGNIVITMKGSSGSAAMYLSNIKVTYEASTGSTYTVDYANGGHGTAPSQQTEQTEITLTSLNADGWNHTGWKADKNVKVGGVTKTAGTLLGKTDNCTLTANTTFTAQWECANTIIISKGEETNGTFSLGTPGTVCISDGNASTTVTCSPNAHYHVREVTSTRGGSVTGSGNSWTVSNISGNTTINVTFEEDTKYTVIFKNAGTQVSSKQVYANEAIGALPEKGTMESCDDSSTTFMGWTTATISEKTSTEPTYVTAETEVDHDNFVVNAVWAKEE